MGKTFYLKHVTENVVCKELLHLNASKSTSLGGIPAKFLKDGAEVLKLPITWIINVSISGNAVPSENKLARVKPLYKKNSNTYWPVSILSIVSKILERAVYIQLETCLVEINILYEYQSGFRKAFSTDTYLIHLLDHIKVNNASGFYTGMILLDLQKEFLILWTMRSCVESWKLWVLAAQIGLCLIYRIEDRLSQMVKLSLTQPQLPVEFYKVEYWALFCFCVM